MKIAAGNPYTYAVQAIKMLDARGDYASITSVSSLYVELRREFFNRFQHGFVFPTSITMNFFENVVYWLPRGDFVDNKGKSEYVSNFNSWLKIARSVK